MERCISSMTASTKQSVPYMLSTCGFFMMVGVIFLIHGASGFSAALHRSFSGKNHQRRRTMELLLHSSLSSVTRSTSRSSGGLTHATNFSYDGGSASAGVMESFQHRQAMYDRMRMKAACSTTSSKNITRTLSLWSFEALFPKPVWDEEIIQKDLSHYVNAATLVEQNPSLGATKDLKYSTLLTDKGQRNNTVKANSTSTMKKQYSIEKQPRTNTTSGEESTASINNSTSCSSSSNKNNGNITSIGTIKSSTSMVTIDVELTRKVKDRVYGMRTITTAGGLGSSPVYDYDTSLIDASRAVQFTPDGRRIGRALKINIDTLTYTAKCAFRKHNIKLAEQLYSRANNLDPYDGRPYLGLSRCAEKRQDLVAARNYLKMGIRNAIYDNNIIINNSNNNNRGLTTKNPFLLQALGTLEEKVGHLAEAERLYVAAVNAQPSHAAAWVALAQLRTEKLRQSVDAGRSCYESAKRELALAGLPPSSYVYVAWAALEWKRAGNVKLARNLFHQAIAVDPKCSAAYLQLGVMEAEVRNWNRARECFESVLIFDNRNSRALQAFAIMESKRPDGDSRTAIGLFEQALKVNPKDAGVYQAYALYVASLGDIDAAKNL
jgi:tetratricopeptide (TPR) repeat protein